jgi:hypothetical protein
MMKYVTMLALSEANICLLKLSSERSAVTRRVPATFRTVNGYDHSGR